ncbi:MAG: hypothetical protein AAF573_17970, partial [Bacteroidota bacterium]
IGMTKTLAIAMSSVLLVSLGIFSFIQVKKLNSTKANLTQQLKNIEELEQSLNDESAEKSLLSQMNIDLEDENQVLRDSIEKLHRVIAKLRRKVKAQDATIIELKEKLAYLEDKYLSKKQEIAILSRKENVDTSAIAKIEEEKAIIKDEMADLQMQEREAASVKMMAEKEIQDKIESEERFRKIVDVVNNTRIKFEDIQIKMDPAGNAVTRLISEGKNWKHTAIEFFMNHSNNKILLDEQFIVKIIDMDYQEELPFFAQNPMTPKNDTVTTGAPFYFDGNLVEIYHNNDFPKKGKNFEVQVYYRCDDGEEYLLLDGVKQFIKDGNVLL